MKFRFLNRAVDVDSDYPALISGQVKLTYQDLDKKLNDICNNLYDEGIHKNSLVIIIGSHDHEFILILLSLWRLGVIPIPLNTRLTDAELNNLLHFSSASHILIDQNCRRSLDSTAQKIILYPVDPKIISSRPTVDINPEANGIIIFTSGTTGKPKGVVLTIQNLLSSAEITNNILMPAVDDVWIASLPFYHIGGIMILVRAFLAGMKVVIPESFDADDLFYCFKNFRPSFISLVPTVLKRLLEKKAYPNPELKYVLLGGGPVNNELALEAVVKGWKILKVYGASETCSMFTALYLNNNSHKLSSAGLPLPGNIIKIMNENREELPAGLAGEIAVSGPAVFKEYLYDSALTNNKIRNNFYFTGDIGYLDAEGYLFIESRRNDLIISGGENINPLEIEEALYKIPGVIQTCVIGLPDDEWGQIPVAAINTSGTRDQNQILNELRKTLSPFKLPRRIYFLDKIPSTELGKINRYELKKLLS